MRRELILVLLGVISTSFLSSFLSGYVQIVPDKVLLDTVAGVVGAGNFSYWQLGHTGPLLVELTSLSGDADLYISENIRPGYEVDRNNFSSATCGEDLVNIPADFPRPLGIGVFGHWSHEQSEYSIQIFLDRAAASEPNVFDPRNELSGSDGDTRRSRDNVVVRKHEEENKPRFMKLLSLLDMIFEIFVM
ncbi:hypothetical protein NE865_00671 [Phthorimaea operculella]|nr:hypothetical protein NE865_00671 [Phthorimaea operculella]